MCIRDSTYRIKAVFDADGHTKTAYSNSIIYWFMESKGYSVQRSVESDVYKRQFLYRSAPKFPLLEQACINGIVHTPTNISRRATLRSSALGII